MNYSNFPMTQLDYKSFIHNMEKQHSIEWTKVQNDINHAIKGKKKKKKKKKRNILCKIDILNHFLLKINSHF